MAVANARMASGRRRNPFMAAGRRGRGGAWVWALADRFVVDQSVGMIVVGFAAQAAVLYVPFFLLATPPATRSMLGRTPLRIAYLAGVCSGGLPPGARRAHDHRGIARHRLRPARGVPRHRCAAAGVLHAGGGRGVPDARGGDPTRGNAAPTRSSIEREAVTRRHAEAGSAIPDGTGLRRPSGYRRWATPHDDARRSGVGRAVRGHRHAPHAACAGSIRVATVCLRSLDRRSASTVTGTSPIPATPPPPPPPPPPTASLAASQRRTGEARSIPATRWTVRPAARRAATAPVCHVVACVTCPCSLSSSESWW